MRSDYSYAYIAKKDLQASIEMYRTGMYNHFARLCQQFVEKIFKDILENNSQNKEHIILLHSHKIHRLSQAISETTGIVFSKSDNLYFRTLTDYYFDINYPNEDYLEIEEQEAVEVHADTLNFLIKFKKNLAEKNISTIIDQEIIKKFENAKTQNAERIELAKKMLKKGYDKNEIADVLELDIEDFL